MLFSPACERNKGPILAVLKEWLPAHAQVLEIGSGSGQHAAFFCQQIGGLAWQSSERRESLTDLQAQLEALVKVCLALYCFRHKQGYLSGAFEGCADERLKAA